MALPATDNFNRANENPLAGNWTTITAHQNCQLLNNAVQSSSSGDAGAFWNADVFDNDQYSLAQITSPGSGIGGVTVRTASAANTFYLWWFNVGVGICRIYKNINGTYTQLGSDYSITILANDIIKLSVSGTTLTPRVNTTDYATQTDSGIASGSAGFRPFSNTVHDNWEGGNIGAAGETIVIDKMGLTYSGKTLKANTKFYPGKMALAYTGMDLKTNYTIHPSLMALQWSGKSVKANELIKPAKMTLQWVGKDVSIISGEVIEIAKMALQWVGKTLKVNEVIRPARMVLRWTGKSVVILGEAIGEYIISFRRRKR